MDVVLQGLRKVTCYLDSNGEYGGGAFGKPGKSVTEIATVWHKS